MNHTPFPARPDDVVALTGAEFLFDLEMSEAPPLDVVCRRFGDDANRALVWLIRFRALRAWRARPDTTEWLSTSAALPGEVCEVAAGLELNDRWEFDVEGFRSAVDAVIRRRCDAEQGRTIRQPWATRLSGLWRGVGENEGPEPHDSPA